MQTKLCTVLRTSGPSDANLLRHHIRLEMASVAYGDRTRLIALAANPDDKFATSERERAVRKIKELTNETLEAKP